MYILAPPGNQQKKESKEKSGVQLLYEDERRSSGAVSSGAVVVGPRDKHQKKNDSREAALHNESSVPSVEELPTSSCGRNYVQKDNFTDRKIELNQTKIIKRNSNLEDRLVHPKLEIGSSDDYFFSDDDKTVKHDVLSRSGNHAPRKTDKLLLARVIKEIFSDVCFLSIHTSLSTQHDDLK